MHSVLSFNSATQKVWWVLLSLIVILSGSLQAAPVMPLPRHIIVITTNKTPLIDRMNKVGLLKRQGILFDSYNLDAVDVLEARWSKGLPATEDAAKRAFEQRLDSVGKDVFTQELVNAYRGLSTAIKYQIDRYPAIIFDKQWVVYGVLDLDIALQRYADFIRQQGEGL